jgi:hypothetical protein
MQACEGPVSPPDVASAGRGSKGGREGELSVSRVSRYARLVTLLQSTRGAMARPLGAAPARGRTGGRWGPLNVHAARWSAAAAAHMPSPWMQSSIEPTRITPSKEMKIATFMDATGARSKKGRTR